MLQKSEAIEKMNFLGKEGVPFLFVIDFLGEQNIIQALDEIDAKNLMYSVGDKTNAVPSESANLNKLM